MSMNKHNHTIIFIAVIVLASVQLISCDFVATVSCQACTITCGWASCYRIVADGYDGQVCGTTSCSLTNSYQESLTKCSYDYYGNACSAGVCVLPPESGCASTVLADNGCDRGISWMKLSCGACRVSETCFSCLFTQDSTMTTASQSCLGPSCNSVQPINITYSSCTSDAQGNACSCCYTFSASLVNQGGICISNEKILQSASFAAFAQGRILWESSLWGSVSAVLLLLGMNAGKDEEHGGLRMRMR